MHQCLFILPIIFMTTWITRLTAGSPDLHVDKTGPDSVILYPGFFLWDERTVLTVESEMSRNMTGYQEMLDHSNTDFSDHPVSVIQLCIDGEISDEDAFIIEVTQDTIFVKAPSMEKLDTALGHLYRMKKTAERNSPDYGLIYIRCGFYRYDNF